MTSVSYILSGDQKRYVSSELRDKVMKVAEEIHYVKSGLATGLKGQNRKTLGMIVPQFENIFFTRLTTGVEEIAYKYGYILNVCNSFDNSQREREILENLIMHRIDGVIISPTESSDENIQYLREFGIPFVLADRALKDQGACDAVLTDNFHSGFMAAKHLLDQGHRHIAFVDWDTNIPNLKDRTSGSLKAFKRKNLSKDHMLLLSYKDLRSPPGSILVEEIKKHPEITGIIFGNNIIAENMYKYICENHSPVLDHMSVVTIGTPVWTDFCYPPVTCVDLREHEVGRRSAKKLIEKIEHEKEKLNESPLIDIVPCRMKKDPGR